MSTPFTPAELTAYTSMKQAIVAIRLTLGRQVQQLAGVSLVQFEILFFLEQAPDGMRMHELAEAVGVSRSGLTYQVGLLEGAGWVRRESTATNARAVTATLTDAGRERVSGLQEQHFALVRERAFGLLSADELQLMTSIFQRIAAGSAQDPTN